MLYRFIDEFGSFELKDPCRYNIYFPLTDAKGKLLSSIGPNLSGDIKRDNEHFLTPPASIEDLRSSPLCRREFFIKADNRIIRLSRLQPETGLRRGSFYHRMVKRIRGLEIEILNFIPADLAVEVMRVRVRNISRRSIDITPTSFIPL